MSGKKFVTYEEFGALGDGVTNDFPAIYAAHNYANENGFAVKAEAGKTYYISDTRIDGKAVSAQIKTDVVWSGASFTIDDSPYSTHENYGMYTKSIFEVVSDYPVEIIDDEATLQKIFAEGLNKKTKKIEVKLDYPALLIPFNSKHKIYRRKGYGQWMGELMHEVILVDKNGNIDEETPVMWDYNHIDYVKVIRADVKPITIEGGKFTTVACNTNCVVYDEAGKPIGVKEMYVMRGIFVNRSNATLIGVEHYVTGEISVERQIKGEVGPPYRGFFISSEATHLTFEDCVMTGKRCYSKGWIGEGFGGTMGTYDLSGNCVNKIVFKNCTQSNFWVTLDENKILHPAKEGDPGALLSLSQMENGKGKFSRMYWGVGGTNYCKNMEYVGCTLTRYDAHQGLCNGKIKDSTIVAIALTGYGDMYIENTRVFAESHAGGANRLFSTREDYGCTWEGNIHIKDMKAYLYTRPSQLQNAVAAEYTGFYCTAHRFRNWYFGYDCHFPNITIDGLEIFDIETFKPVADNLDINLLTRDQNPDPGLHLPNTYMTHPFFPDVDEDGDGFVDGTKIPFDDVVSRGGILDESTFKNLNPIVPPEYVKVINNKRGYKFVVYDTSSYEGMVDGGFFGKTRFISDNETLVGTSHTDKTTETFKFISTKGE